VAEGKAKQDAALAFVNKGIPKDVDPVAYARWLQSQGIEITGDLAEAIARQANENGQNQSRAQILEGLAVMEDKNQRVLDSSSGDVKLTKFDGPTNMGDYIARLAAFQGVDPATMKESLLQLNGVNSLAELQQKANTTGIIESKEFGWSQDFQNANYKNEFPSTQSGGSSLPPGYIPVGTAANGDIIFRTPDGQRVQLPPGGIQYNQSYKLGNDGMNAIVDPRTGNVIMAGDPSKFNNWQESMNAQISQMYADDNRRIVSAAGRMVFAGLEGYGGYNMMVAGGAPSATGEGAVAGVPLSMAGGAAAGHAIMEFGLAGKEIYNAIIHNQRRMESPIVEVYKGATNSQEAPLWAHAVDDGIGMLGAGYGVVNGGKILGKELFEVTAPELIGMTMAGGTASFAGAYAARARGEDLYYSSILAMKTSMVFAPVGGLNAESFGAYAGPGGMFMGFTAFDLATQYNAGANSIDDLSFTRALLIGGAAGFATSVGGGLKSAQEAAGVFGQVTNKTGQYMLSAFVADTSFWGASTAIAGYATTQEEHLREMRRDPLR